MRALLKSTAIGCLVTMALSIFAVPDVEARGPRSFPSSSRMRHAARGHKSHKSHSKASRRRHQRSVAKKVHAVYRGQIGFLVQAADGAVVASQLSDNAFNPASAIKLLTAYGALKTWGPEHRFTTTLYTDGQLDSETGVLTGNLYVVGNDPDFKKADAGALAQSLLDHGVQAVDGDLIVSRRFSLYSGQDSARSASALKKIWTSGSAGVHISINGSVSIGSAPETATELAAHDSERLQETLKVMLSRSLNGVADRIGTVLGGPAALEELASANLGVQPSLASTSGLGINRITPKQMMVVLKGLELELARHGLGFKDIMPLAGIDGTLEKRFTSPDERGSVIAKTGTLTTTDGGASTLVGVMRSAQEDLYFVIFCWKGGPAGFRSKQDSMIRQLQDERGGPRSFESTSTAKL